MTHGHIFVILFSMPEQTSLPIDKTLTPGNAEERGYMWMYDIFDGMVNDPSIKSLVQDDGYKLGKAGENNIGGTGLYRPLRPQAPSS